MKKLLKSALTYLIVGLVAGVFAREFPRFVDSANFVEESQLPVLHTHALALGLFVFLFLLILAKTFNIHQHKHFNKFFITYNVGLAMTLAMMFIHGIWVAVGNNPHPAFSGVAGIGHIIITVGFALLFKILFDQVKSLENTSIV